MQDFWTETALRRIKEEMPENMERKQKAQNGRKVKRYKTKNELT